MIGQNMDVKAITAALDNCLVTDAEYAGGQAVWSSLNDPFAEGAIPLTLISGLDNKGSASVFQQVLDTLRKRDDKARILAIDNQLKVRSTLPFVYFHFSLTH